jgi:hypothetical protein
MSTAFQFHINRSLSCYGLFCKLFTKNENDIDFEYCTEPIYDDDFPNQHHKNCKCALCFGLEMSIKLPGSYSKFYSHYTSMHSSNYLVCITLSNITMARIIMYKHYNMVPISN